MGRKMKGPALLALCVLLTGMRDPFRPPLDVCRVAELAQWRYQGLVNGIALLQDGKKGWHRVRADAPLPPGWRVAYVAESELVVDVGESCEPQQWTWIREGARK